MTKRCLCEGGTGRRDVTAKKRPPHTIHGLQGLILLLLAVICLASSCTLRLPKAEALPVDIVKSTPERLARGKYLVEHVAVCVDCHSKRDWDKFSGPIVPGTEGQGGEVFDSKQGVRGVVYGTNITPAGIGHWSESELLRAMTIGVSKEGRVLFPVMPYRSYQHLTKADAGAIITYLRTLKAIDHKVPPRRLNPLVALFIRSFVPKNVRLADGIDRSDSVRYGQYLTTLANCGDCHTPKSFIGKPKQDLYMSGGVEFELPQGKVLAANITPDPETGIAHWTKATFVARFKAFDGPRSRTIPVRARQRNTVMPWTLYGGMSEKDLGAIYDFLSQVKPVHNRVTSFVPNTTP